MENNPKSLPPTITLPRNDYENLLATVKRQEEEIKALEFRVKTLLEDQ